MSGSNEALNVYLEKNQIAKIMIVDDQLVWNYSQNWQETGYAISPHLPLNEEIPTLNVQRFLKNLLPEGNALEELVASIHTSRNNTFGLVRALGLDITGALIIISANQERADTGHFRLIPDAELEDRLNNRDVFGLIIWDGKPRLSVAGVQDKINVVVNHQNETGFGEGCLSSTHILKFEKQKQSHLVLNEYLSMQLARECGLNVATVQLKRFGQHPALLVERFDRKLITDEIVKRRHVIDGCQALNLPPEYKYEQNFGSARDVAHIRDGASLKKLFNFARQCINPAKTRQQILDWVLFNLLIFNCDAHGKNISFFVNAKGISLAPYYDLVNIKMYPEFEHELAMALGDEFDENNINAFQLADFAETCALPKALVTRRLNYLIDKLKIALQKEITSLSLNEQEINYLKKYQDMVFKRCLHLQEQGSPYR